MPLFASNAAGEVTTKDMANAAGVSEALLYRHFAGKEELYHAILHECVSQSTATVELLSELPDSTETLILCVYALMWKIQTGAKEPEVAMVHRILQRSIMDDGQFAKLFIAKTSAPWVEKMRRCVMGAAAQGDLVGSEDDAELAIWLAHHASVTVLTYRLAPTEVMSYGMTDEKLLERSVRVMLRAVGVKEALIEANYKPKTFSALIAHAKS